MPAVEQEGGRQDLADDLALLTQAAHEAGRIALKYFRRNPEVWLKGGTSPVSEADYAADRYLRETLLAARPHYGWLSEETADDPARLARERTFVVDPIDGTRGFLEGQREWCVSVAVVEHGRTLAGVLDCPAKEQTYIATRAGGAFRDGKRLTLVKPDRAPTIGGPGWMIDALPPEIRQTVRRAQYVPSLACRLAMVADGTLDATFVKPNSQDWDLAAAHLVLEEAGGMLLDESGLAPTYAGADTGHGSLVAGSGALLAAMAVTIRK